MIFLFFMFNIINYYILFIINTIIIEISRTFFLLLPSILLSAFSQNLKYPLTVGLPCAGEKRLNVSFFSYCCITTNHKNMVYQLCLGHLIIGLINKKKRK